jgi:hypothetical protein
MSATNWKTPKTEKLLALEAARDKRAKEICTQYPHLDDDTVAAMILATPKINVLLDEEIKEELLHRMIEEAIDEDCFVYGADKKLIEDTELLKMSDRELAAWAQKNDVMYEQLKAHIAERENKPFMGTSEQLLAHLSKKESKQHHG